MNSISIDFKNCSVCFMNATQRGTETVLGLKKEAFNSFIPEGYRDKDSFTWNFEGGSFAINQDYTLHDGCIMTKDCFIPQTIIPMSKLNKRYREFIAILGYEEFNLKDEISKEFGNLFGV